MISVDLVYKTVLKYANSDIRGNVTPDTFNLFACDSVNEIYEEYFEDLTRAINRQNRGLADSGLSNLPDRIKEKMEHYLVESNLIFAGDKFEFPSDMRYLESLCYNDNDVEIAKNKQEFNLGKTFCNSETFPLGVRLTTKNAGVVSQFVKIAPNSITSGVVASYLRNPLMPKWTYEVVMGSEVYNPSATDHQDIDLHSSEKNNVILRIAHRFGINLKEQDLQVNADKELQEDFNQKITN